MAEFREKFPGAADDEPREVVCDDCWKLMGLDEPGPAPPIPGGKHV
jgi:hypothetical protein